MFVIQTAIDRYEKAFPDKPSPSVAEALEWNAKRSRPGRERRHLGFVGGAAFTGAG